MNLTLNLICFWGGLAVGAFAGFFAAALLTVGRRRTPPPDHDDDIILFTPGDSRDHRR